MIKQSLKYSLLVVGSFVLIASCSTKKQIGNTKDELLDTIVLNYENRDIQFMIDFEKGQAHNHPTFAIWLEDLEGKYLQTLFVTKSIATGIFAYAETEDGKWINKEGKVYRPAALPYWQNKKKEASVDAYSGATPKGKFVLKTGMNLESKSKINLLLEINQPWDWNSYWNNTKYSDNQNYMTSCQPSLVYSVRIDLNEKQQEYYLSPIGHGHYAGDNGRLYTDLTTFTTALKIIKRVKVTVQ